MNEEPKFRPLSQRDAPLPQDVLFDGVPEHLLPPLSEWITNYLNGASKLIQRVALRLRIPLKAPEARALIDAVISRDPQNLLDLLDMTIHLDLQLRWESDVVGLEENFNEASLADWIPKWKWPKGQPTRGAGATGRVTGRRWLSVPG
jgi:hypothetical protein